MELNRNQLLNIVGGFSISGTLINAFVRGINSILDLGRSIGTAIRRMQNGNICPL